MLIGFLPNLVLRFALSIPLRVPKFSPIGARIHVLWQILQSVRKEVEEKNQEKNPNFGHSYLGNGWSDFLQIWYVDSHTSPALLWQLWFQSDKESRSYKGVKITFTFFL